MMHFDKLFKLFIPKSISFYPLFEEGVQNLVRASGLLKRLMTTGDDDLRETIIRQIKDVELAGDDLTHRIYEQLNKSFLIPFDREDIHELASTSDDVIDLINGSAQRIGLYKPVALIPVFNEMADIIHQCAKEIEYSVNSLREAGMNKEKILKACIRLNTLENRGDDIFHQGISNLFDTERNATELIKQKEILETLEKTVNRAEDVSDTIKTILIKIG